jgi:hypothetical protein
MQRAAGIIMEPALVRAARSDNQRQAGHGMIPNRLAIWQNT